jgi:DNA-directed RNA polymerase II subunit RPB1
MKPMNASRIIGIQFSIASPAEIRKNSVVEVVSRDTYTNNKPSIGGLFDPRMGVLEPGAICPTDGHTYIDSPGYFGHLELARPVFFIQHLKHIVNICKCVCIKCSKYLGNKSKHAYIMDLPSEERWNAAFALASVVKRCGDKTDDGCGCKQPAKIKVSGLATIQAVWDIAADGDATVDATGEATKTSTKLTPEIVAKIFRRISNDDVAFMGFHPLWSRPEWMICEVLPVPPPAGQTGRAAAQRGRPDCHIQQHHPQQ